MTKALRAANPVVDGAVFVKWLAGFCACVAIAVMFAWIAGLDVLKSLLPGLATMKFNTALCFFLAASSLFAWNRERPVRYWRAIGWGGAVGVTVIAALTIAEFLMRRSIGIDQLLVADTASLVEPGRMSVGTAVSFFLLGCALLCAAPALRAVWMVGQGATLLVFTIGVIALLGYIFNVNSLYGLRFFATMAVHTALLFCMLALGLLLRPPYRGVMAGIMSRSIEGTILRAALPMAMVLPVVVGFASYAGRNQLYGPGFGFALFCFFTSLLLIVFIYVGAMWLGSLQARVDEGEFMRAHAAAIIESSHDVIISKNLDGIITGWNPSAERVYGYAAKEMIGEPITRLFPPELIGQERTILERVARGDPASDFDTIRRRKDGTLTNVSILVSPIRNEHGVVVGASHVERDIEERKRAEREIREKSMELERSNRDLEQFAYVASHDLQEPLRAVTGSVQLFQMHYRDKMDARAEEYVRHAVEGAGRMQRLIRDLLAYSRVGRGGQTVRRTDSRAIVEQVLADLHPSVVESDAIVEYESLPQVAGVDSQLRLLFRNVIGNALKFRRPGVPPRIVITAEAEGPMWRFSIADNGIGIESQYIDRIFIIFQRLHTREEYSGTGIGLALCKRIVELHGGTISATSTPGQGSVFSFTLPAAADETPEDETPEPVVGEHE